MNYFINKKKLIKKNTDDNYCIFKINSVKCVNFYMSKINCKNNSNLIIINNNLKKLLLPFFNKNNNFTFYRKNKQIQNNYNLVITDTQKNIPLDCTFENVYLFDVDNTKINDIVLNYNHLWLFSYNPDLIYFHNSNFIKKIINNSSYIEFENKIINFNLKIKQVKINNIIIKYYVPNLNNKLLFLDYENIKKHNKNIIRDYKIKFSIHGQCNICYNNTKLLKSDCCNSHICLDCYLINRKKYLRCPYCRFNYENKNIINNIPNNSYLYVKNTNYDFEFNLKNLEYYHKINLKIKDLIFDCYVRKSLLKKTVIFVNINKIIVAKLIEQYFSTLKNFKIVCYLPKYY
jgi:hypothetical protein